MSKLKWLLPVLRHLGPGWVLFRVRYALERKTGRIAARTPAGEWPAAGEGSEPPVALPPQLYGSVVAPGPQAVVEADEILRGCFRLFSWKHHDAGFPPDWHRHPISGGSISAERHWTEISETSSGDIKLVWELSRFGWAYPLARAYARTGNERYAEGFWELLEDWMRRNPPNRGPQWMCGQEASFRLMAATFGAAALRRARASTPARWERLAQLAGATGSRVAGNLEYALRQGNNHGVSECVGLITASLLVPAHERAAAWRKRGLDRLQAQLDELVYPDGGFSQHSANYHRVLLQDVLWTITALRAYEQPVPDWLIQSGRRALNFIAALTDVATGRVPSYGANDGAHVLPLADGDYWDFRPLVQAGAAVLCGERWLGEGPWDEAASWLVGRPVEELPFVALQEKPSRFWPDAGLVQVRSGEMRAILRSPVKFRHRPSQADLLAMEIEWRGRPVVIDPGTLSYLAERADWPDLSAARAHSTITIDGAEPLAKATRFLYLPWPTGQVRGDETGGFEATHDGWRRLGVTHARKVQTAGPDAIAVEDRVVAAAQHRVRLHWLLGDFPYALDTERERLTLDTPAGRLVLAWSAPKGAVVSLVRADRASGRGWWAPNYLQEAPALSLAIEFACNGEARVTTSFSAERAT